LTIIYIIVAFMAGLYLPAPYERAVRGFVARAWARITEGGE
jgi:hypothetical protein